MTFADISQFLIGAATFTLAIFAWVMIIVAIMSVLQRWRRR